MFSKRFAPKTLLVEGVAEENTIPELLEKNGVPWSKPYPVTMHDCKGVENLLKVKLPLALKDENVQILGVLVDADYSVANRWKAIIGAVKKETDNTVTLPEVLAADGFLG